MFWGQKDRRPHEKCVFDDPLHIECRYCGFITTIEDDGEVTPRKLASPAAMHVISPTGFREGEMKFNGIDFFVDICGDRTMVVLGSFTGLLDLCDELFEGELVSESPASISAHLENRREKEVE